MNSFMTGILVRSARTALHMTQQELANLMGVSQSTISNIENGLDLPQGELLEQLADILGLDIPGVSGKDSRRRSGGGSGRRGNIGGNSNGRSGSSGNYHTTNVNINVGQNVNAGKSSGTSGKPAGNSADKNTDKGTDASGEKNGEKSAGRKNEKTVLSPEMEACRTDIARRIRRNLNSLNQMEEEEFRDFQKALNLMERYMLEVDKPNKAVTTIFGK